MKEKYEKKKRQGTLWTSTHMPPFCFDWSLNAYHHVSRFANMYWGVFDNVCYCHVYTESRDKPHMSRSTTYNFYISPLNFQFYQWGLLSLYFFPTGPFPKKIGWMSFTTMQWTIFRCGNTWPLHSHMKEDM